MTEKILLVEDNDFDIILTLKEIKRMCLAHEVVVRKSAQDALDYLDEECHLTLLILLDLGLPGMSGAAVAYHAKHDHRTKHIPIVILTGTTEDEGVAKFLGCDGYLMKPLTSEKLIDLLWPLGLEWKLQFRREK
jgi:CheY-like chemotaxis protein